MRLLPALALCLPVVAWAGVGEYIADGYEGESMGADELRLLSWYASAICVVVALQSLFGHGVFDPVTLGARWRKALAYALAAWVCWAVPGVGGVLMLAAVTLLIVVLGLSRR